MVERGRFQDQPLLEFTVINLVACAYKILVAAAVNTIVAYIFMAP